MLLASIRLSLRIFHRTRIRRVEYRPSFHSFSYSPHQELFSFMPPSRTARRKFAVNYEAGAFMSKRYTSTILDKLTCAGAGSKAWKLGKWWHKAACKFSTSFASILPRLQLVNGRPGKTGAPR